jgi:hypothetical protein
MVEAGVRVKVGRLQVG